MSGYREVLLSTHCRLSQDVSAHLAVPVGTLYHWRQPGQEW
jgi:hypothetical protein